MLLASLGRQRALPFPLSIHTIISITQNRALTCREISEASSGPLGFPMSFHVTRVLWECICQRKSNHRTTFNNGSLGSRIDEERSEMRYVMWIAEFRESLNLWTHLAPLGIPRGMPVWVSLELSKNNGFDHYFLELEVVPGSFEKKTPRAPLKCISEMQCTFFSLGHW
jgi:hypothetical protein